MPILPPELTEDILCRLPVKSLKRFRSVAKSWRSLIDGENFIKLHLRQSLISCSHRQLILGGLGLYSIDLECLDEAHVIKPPFYYKSFDGVTNSCNGLVLVMSEPLVLWNPFSRNYKILPDSSVKYPRGLDYYSQFSHGFAFDSKDDDYKVLKVVECRNTFNHAWISTQTEIYSLKSNSWKKIENFPYSLPFLGINWHAHVNEALHTLVHDPENVCGYRIIAFSFVSEKHYEVMLPADLRIRGVDLSLDVVGECLCLTCTYRSRVVMWVMKVYGVKESWSKLLSIRPLAMEPHDTVKPLIYSKDGKKVMLNCDGKRLIWYDLRKKSVEEIPIDGLPFVFYAGVCVESLVSLEEPGEVKKVEKEEGEGTRNKRDDFLSEGFKLVL